MSLSPEQIVAEEFRLRARGYDRDEVDAFLDRLADQVEADAAHRHTLEQRVKALEGELAAAREREATLTRTLVTVQDAADRVRTEAEAEVATLRTATERELAATREQAKREADERRSTAEAEAARLRASAADEAARLRASAADEVAQLRARLHEVQHLDAAHREQLRAHLGSQLQALEALPDPYAELLPRVAADETAAREAYDLAAGASDLAPPPWPTTAVDEAPAATPAPPAAPPADGLVDGDPGGGVPPVGSSGEDADPWHRSDDATDAAEDATDAAGDVAAGQQPDGAGDERDRQVEPDPPIWS
ncbi:MAG: DivIVA domain-containing protein [Nitriliruptoraceae bacterium]